MVSSKITLISHFPINPSSICSCPVHSQRQDPRLFIEFLTTSTQVFLLFPTTVHFLIQLSTWGKHLNCASFLKTSLTAFIPTFIFSIQYFSSCCTVLLNILIPVLTTLHHAHSLLAMSHCHT